MSCFRAVMHVVVRAFAVFLALGAATVAQTAYTHEMDRAVKPGDDFYRYANGKLAQNGNDTGRPVELG
jgi:hypothetical protein